MDDRSKLRPLRPLPNLIFMSRWLQLPLYLGLIVAQAVINAAAYDSKTIMAQAGIHITFLLSAMAIAASDRIMPQPQRSHAPERPGV